MDFNDRRALAAAIIWLLILCGVISVASAQTYMPVSTHPNFDSYSRDYIGAANDCSVIAWAIAADVPYHKAFDGHSKYCGRQNPAEPTRLESFADGVVEMAYQHHRELRFVTFDANPTLAQLAAQFPDQRIFCLVRGHAAAITNGVVWDNLDRKAMDAEVLGAIFIYDSFCE